MFIDTGSATVLIDTGPNSSVLEFLEGRGVDSVDLVIISHADQDHVGGLSTMLSNGVEVRRILWNSDGLKHTGLWRSLCYQLDDLEIEGATRASEEISAGMSIEGLGDRLRIQVLAPRTRLRRLGVGGEDKSGARIGSNSVSAVVRLFLDDEPIVVIPGDLDDVGLAHLSDPEMPEMRAKYLVLPHHGGRMANTPDATATALSALIRAVEPQGVFVSNGRTTRMDNPREEVLGAVRVAAPSATITCSQLSKTCAPLAVAREDSTESYSAGWSRGHACAGTIPLTRREAIESHQLFVDTQVANPRCRAECSEG